MCEWQAAAQTSTLEDRLALAEERAQENETRASALQALLQDSSAIVGQLRSELSAAKDQVTELKTRLRDTEMGYAAERTAHEAAKQSLMRLTDALRQADCTSDILQWDC